MMKGEGEHAYTITLKLSLSWMIKVI